MEPWNVYDHTGVPELRPGEPKKGKIKSGKSGKKKSKREKNTWKENSTYELADRKLPNFNK